MSSNYREEMEEDFYAVLGIEGGGAQVSQLEVRKAYRNRALVWHPDKQVGKKPSDVESAATEFERIQRAHDVLGDEKAKTAYDELRELRRSRLEREKQMSSKRQKMMQDLRDRERVFEAERDNIRDQELAMKRLQAEMARIREAHKRRTTRPGFDFSGISQPPGQSQNGKPRKTPPAPAATPAQTSEMQNTLKVTWASTEGGLGGYTATRLKEIFEEFGPVEDVVIRESKSRKKGSALVVMKSKDAAIAAINVPCGDFSNPLLATPLMPSTSTQTEPEVASEAVSAQDGGMSNVIGSGYRSYENDILTKMRQAASRADKARTELQEGGARS